MKDKAGAEEAAASAGLIESMLGQRLFPPGKRIRCPVCAARSFVGRDDLHVEVIRPGAVHAFRRLHGARCTRCGAQSLEPYEQIGIEDELGATVVSDYQARVTNIGSGTVGTCWPKDVQRLMGLRKGRGLKIQVIDRDTMLVRVE